jgi:hypothetical protein
MPFTLKNAKESQVPKEFRALFVFFSANVRYGRAGRYVTCAASAGSEELTGLYQPCAKVKS